jgi:hypothetical protein
MSKPLPFEIEIAGETARVSFHGTIDADASFAQILECNAKHVVLDLSGLVRVTSPGVREWVQFIHEMDARGRPMTFERCSVTVVSQLNMVFGFAGSAEVRSVLAPYFCPACEREHAELIDLTVESARVQTKLPCPQCGERMEFEDIAETYLAFMKR